MGGQIYCYGVDDSFYSLNIVGFSGKSVESMNDKWEIIQPNTPFNTESRTTPSAIVLPDGKRFLLQGGYSKDTKIINQTIIYDTTTNSWQNGSPYIEEDKGVRQMYVYCCSDLFFIES